MSLIEFLGVPGVGKTTLARSTADQLRESGQDVVFMPMDEAANLGRWSDRARGLIDIAGYALVRPSQMLRSAGIVRLFPQPSLLTSIKALGYWLRTHALVHKHAARAAFVVLDQGFYQGLYSWALLGRRLEPAQLLAAMDGMPRPDLLVVMTAPPATVRARLAGRCFTHRWIDGLLLEDQEWIDKSTAIIALIERAARATGCPIIRCEASNGVEQCTREILAAIERRWAVAARSTWAETPS
jgi:thymidylate kinase